MKNVAKFINSLTTAEELGDAFAFALFQLDPDALRNTLRALPNDQLQRLAYMSKKEHEYNQIESALVGLKKSRNGK